MEASRGEKLSRGNDGQDKNQSSAAEQEKGTTRKNNYRDVYSSG